MAEEQAPTLPRPLDCNDFDRTCCGSCDEDVKIYRGDQLYALVCCDHVSQAELRRDGITRPVDL